MAVVASAGYFLLRRGVGSDAWKLAGMLSGVYTGGTVNLAAVAAKPGGRLGGPDSGGKTDLLEDYDSYAGIFRRAVIVPLLVALGLAALIGAFGGGISLLFPKDWGSVVVILIFTTLGILCSAVPSVRRIRMTYHAGQYFILVFCLALGSVANLRKLATSAPSVVGYVALTVFGSLVVHWLFASAFRIDRDTMIDTSVAGICSPPFVPMVSAALRNREVLFPGIITGIIGWVIGTYFGIGMSSLPRAAVP